MFSLHSKQLRSWITRYGNTGVVAVVIILGIRHSRRRRWSALIVIGGTLMASLTFLWPRPAKQPQIVVLPSARAQGVLKQVQTFQHGHDQWRVEVWTPNEESYPDTHNAAERVSFYRNAQFLQQIHSREFGKIYSGDHITVRFVNSPAPFPVFAILVEPGAGHVEVRRFYAAHGDRLESMLEIEQSGTGGPIFQDYDRDGIPEWVFDDYDYYDYIHSPDHDSPQSFLVYKLTPDCKLVFWKSLPNPAHRKLPDVFGRSSIPHERKTTQTVQVGKNVWEIERWKNPEENNEYLKLFCNYLLSLQLPSSDLSGALIAAKPLPCPAPFPVFAVRAHTEHGAGQVTRFYRVQGNRLHIMGEVEGECGGPLFRDYDKDGQPEWVFDDYDYYQYYDDGPAHLRVFKLSRAGRLNLWKTLPHPTRKLLPDRVGIQWSE
jgi:hypothetical protein